VYEIILPIRFLCPATISVVRNQEIFTAREPLLVVDLAFFSAKVAFCSATRVFVYENLDLTRKNQTALMPSLSPHVKILSENAI
jgi:hypothetical protein